MIKVTDNIYVGNSLDESKADFPVILNVAKDLKPTRCWPTSEYYHVGLIDGPGNPRGMYVAAVKVLESVVYLEKRVLVCCHEGKSRSVSVAMMYLAMLHSGDWSGALTMLREMNDAEIPEPNEAHKNAFQVIDWEKLRSIRC